MVILKKKNFHLPRLEKEKFITLLRLGLEYDKERGAFSIKDYNQIEKLLAALAEILDEEVNFAQSCVSCGADFPCKDCKYSETCATRDLPSECVCIQCLEAGKTHGEQL